ncbi:MAG: adenosine deaminase family protein [Candidatus Eremiobacteraeota bacterium]|nr:adenosine deaminase family protein [Candidatus Eremiobacteraeota bacterium]
MISPELIRALPKTDLHLHLDGSLREQTLIELARERGVSLPSETVEGLNELVFRSHYANLAEYLHGFQYTCAVLQDPEALERTAYELAWDNIHEGVRYIEVRFAPQLHTHRGFSLKEVLQAVNRGLARAQSEHQNSPAVQENGEPPFYYGIIVCAMRFFTAAFSSWFAHLIDLFQYANQEQVFGLASLELARAAVRIRDEEGIPIVGFDLAGREDGYPASDHQRAYDFAHRSFMQKTVHAGEAYGPESIFQALTDLHADRIGHGYHLFSPELCGPEVKDGDAYIQRLVSYIAARRITIEVCITSNLQTMPFLKSAKEHAFGKMLEEKLSASLCTDNRLVSHTTVSREIEIAVEAFDMNLHQLRQTLIYGFKRSFFPGPYVQRRAYVRQIIDYYDRLIHEWEVKAAKV